MRNPRLTPPATLAPCPPFSVECADFVLTGLGGGKYQINNRLSNGSLVRVGSCADLMATLATLVALRTVCEAFSAGSK